MWDGHLARPNGCKLNVQQLIPLLSNWGETLISRDLKQRKFVEFSQSDTRGLSVEASPRECGELDMIDKFQRQFPISVVMPQGVLGEFSLRVLTPMLVYHLAGEIAVV